MIIKPIIINGIMKWNIKNLLSVGLDTQNPPHNHSIKQGTEENRFVMELWLPKKEEQRETQKKTRNGKNNENSLRGVENKTHWEAFWTEGGQAFARQE